MAQTPQADNKFALSWRHAKSRNPFHPSYGHPSPASCRAGREVIVAKAESKRIIRGMKQVETVMKLLQPGYNVRSIAIRRRLVQNAGRYFRHVTCCGRLQRR